MSRGTGFAGRASLLAVASAIGRSGSLLLVVAAGRYLGRAEAADLIVALTAGVALTTVLDPQAYDLLLVRPDLAVSSWRPFDRLQRLATGLGGLLAAAFVALVVRPSWPLLVLQAGIVVETYLRFRRVRHQLAGDYRRVAAVDLGLGLARAVAAAALVATGGLVTAVLVHLGGTLVVGLLLVRNPLAPPADATGAPTPTPTPAPAAGGARRLGRRHRHPDEVGQLEALRLALPYGLATTASSLYSQAPPLIVAAIAGVGVSAPLAVISRIVQPTELAAQAVSVTGLHQLSDPALRPDRRVRLYRHMQRAALGLSLLVVVALVVAWPLLGRVMASVTLPWTALALGAASVVVKFQNYQSVAALLARGEARERLRASALAAALCLSLVALTCRPFGLVGALASILVAEVALHVSLRRGLAATGWGGTAAGAAATPDGSGAPVAAGHP